MGGYPYPNHSLSGGCAVGCEEATGRTETSQYPEEKKSTEIPLVVVSESGRAQTCRVSSLQALRDGGCTVSVRVAADSSTGRSRPAL